MNKLKNEQRLIEMRAIDNEEGKMIITTNQQHMSMVVGSLQRLLKKVHWITQI